MLFLFPAPYGSCGNGHVSYPAQCGRARAPPPLVVRWAVDRPCYYFMYDGFYLLQLYVRVLFLVTRRADDVYFACGFHVLLFRAQDVALYLTYLGEEPLVLQTPSPI